MPKLQKPLTIEITPEQFLNACSGDELKELDLLICSPFYQNKMNGQEHYCRLYSNEAIHAICKPQCNACKKYSSDKLLSANFNLEA